MPTRRGSFAPSFSRAASWLLLCGGCADPQARFDAFDARCERSEACVYEPSSAGEACDPPAPGELTGKYWFVLAALAPELPVIFLADVSTSLAPAGGTQLELVLQPVKAADRRTPVCEAIVLPPLHIDEQGRLDAQLPLLKVPGEANGITGRNIAAEPSLHASFCGVRDFYCGDVAGLLIEPFEYDLEGSSFTMLRAEAGAEITGPLEVSCDGDLAGDRPAALASYPPCP